MFSLTQCGVAQRGDMFGNLRDAAVLFEQLKGGYPGDFNFPRVEVRAA